MPVIPAGLILGEALVLAAILLALFVRRRMWMAIILFPPVLYIGLTYALVDTIDIIQARVFVRWGLLALLTVMVVLFGRILWISWRRR